MQEPYNSSVSFTPTPPSPQGGSRNLKCLLLLACADWFCELLLNLGLSHQALFDAVKQLLQAPRWETTALSSLRPSGQWPKLTGQTARQRLEPDRFPQFPQRRTTMKSQRLTSCLTASWRTSEASPMHKGNRNWMKPMNMKGMAAKTTFLFF